jgi:outer membrane protein assembly factor BamB
VEDRIVRVNPFGLGAHADDSPALPTFQRISEIWIYRNFLSTPTPGAPLAPQSINVLVIEWRNNFSTVTKQIVGLSPTTGTIQWQREAAEDLTTTGTEQLSAMTAVGDTFVGYLIAKKDVHYPAYNKAGVEI